MLIGIAGLDRPAGEPYVPNAFAIKGESGTGFEKAGSLGEFECGNCKFFDASAGACDQPDMKAMSKQPRLADGRVSVDAADCCEYVARIGENRGSQNE